MLLKTDMDFLKKTCHITPRLKQILYVLVSEGLLLLSNTFHRFSTGLNLREVKPQVIIFDYFTYSSNHLWTFWHALFWLKKPLHWFCYNKSVHKFCSSNEVGCSFKHLRFPSRTFPRPLHHHRFPPTCLLPTEHPSVFCSPGKQVNQTQLPTCCSIVYFWCFHVHCRWTGAHIGLFSVFEDVQLLC